jgi:hypothetical protein
MGVKRLEARGRATTHRGPLLIHASSAAVPASVTGFMSMQREVIECLQRLGWDSVVKLKSLPRSAILGQVDLVDCVTSGEIEEFEDEVPNLDFDLSAWPDEGVVYWRVQNAIACEPIPTDGKLNVWDLPIGLDEAVSSALTRAVKFPPKWSQRQTSTDPMRVMNFRATGPLAQLIGDEARTFREIRGEVLDWAEGRGLLTDKRCRVDTELSFLSPGRTFLAYEDLFEALTTFMVRAEESGEVHR